MRISNSSITLIYNHSLAGHRVEFFHHLYMEALSKSDRQYVFSYPQKDEIQMTALEWPPAKNIEIVQNRTDELRANPLKSAFYNYKELRRFVNKYKPEELVLMDVVAFMPFACFIRKTRIIGLIATGIYLYTWKNDSKKKRAENAVKYFLFSRCDIFKKIYIQCDTSAPAYLNKLFKTTKFEYICDPVARLSTSSRDLRSELEIPEDRIIVLHPGDLSIRKGSLSLIRGINNCDIQILKRYYFIFAGRVNNSISNEFHILLDSIKERDNCILLMEGFLSFDYLASLVFTSNMLFLPYALTNQSSGIVGYGAEFNKPVVVTREGLLAKIVKRYHLGFIIKDSTEESISAFLGEYSNLSFNSKSNYLSDNTVKEFAKTLIN